MTMSKNFDRPNVLVAGGAGFLGSHICEFLLERYNVICVDDYSTGHEGNVDHLLSHPHFEFVRHTITDPLDFKTMKGLERFRTAFVGVQYVIHAASFGAPAEFIKRPVEMMMANAVGTRNLLELAMSARARFVFISDAILSSNTFTEKHPCYRMTESRKFAEMLCWTYRDLYSLEVSVVRLGDCYGSNVQLDDTRLIPWLIARALRNEEVVLQGSLEKGAFLYVSDACDAVEKVLLAEKTGLYEIGATAVYTVTEVAEKIRALTGSSFILKQGLPSKDIEVVSRYWEAQQYPSDISAIRQETGWFPVVLLDDGLRETIEYMKSLRGAKGVTV